QVAGQGDAAFLICSVDDTVEGLGRLLSGWEHADVVNDDEVGATDAGDHPLDRGVDLGPADSCSERLQREPGHAHALLDDGGSERLAEVGLAGAAGSADGQVLGAADPLQGHQPLLGGGRDGGVLPTPAVEGLARGEAGRPAAHAAGGEVATGDLLEEEHPEDLGRVPALGAGGGADLRRGAAHVGPAHAPEEDVELRRQRRSLGRLHLPNSFQAPVPGWAEKLSSAWTRLSLGRSTCSRMEARSFSPNRSASAARGSAWSTRSRPQRAASSTARLIFARIRLTPLAAAVRNQRSAPGPMSTKACSATVRGRSLGCLMPRPLGWSG